ncbi:MAG: ABC transporter ATP-binding protein [Erysipelotrichaceae bacterium]|nr:ABC transporter ATP-binding protein [Erysipelotrichaceae bacterium]
MVTINNVTKVFDKSFKAVDDLSLEIKENEIFGILGPNGSGKTTTLKMLTGVLSIDKGTIKINGIDVEQDPLSAKKIFGFVPDSPDVFLKLTGMEYLNFLANIYEVSKDDKEQRILDLANKFEMKDSLMSKIESYSHGMRQKIVVMGALLHNPSVWILDEPLTGLDPKSSHTLKQMMREHADRGNSVIFSTHVLEVAEKICDRIAIINRGKLLFCGTLDDLRNKLNDDQSLEEMFLEMVKDV